jgi:hypothetical protein
MFRLFLFLLFFTEIIIRTLNVDSILFERIIDSLMGLCLIAFVFKVFFLKGK